MSNERPNEPPGDADRYSLANLTKFSSLVHFAGIGTVLLALGAAFAATAGWFSPDRLDPARLIDRFEAANGLHPGFRRNHAKGICLTGWFDSNGAGARLSTAAVFAPGRVPVIGRFALGGGMPMAADSPTAARSLALDFRLPNGEPWRTAMNAMPVFPVKDPQAFFEQLGAMAPDPKTGQPNPAAMQAFLAAHPETARALALIKAQPVSSGFADATYNSLNAFLFIDGGGTAHAVRWSMVPYHRFAPRPADAPAGTSYLFDALGARVKRAPVQWRLVLTVGRPGDPTGDATVAWPADREHVEAGVLSVMALQGEDEGACRDINFDPLALPAGIAASDDPLLSARSAAYAESFRRREREAKPSSAVRPGKGS